MGIATGLLVFICIWWMVLFTVLPWGIRQPDEQEPGHMAGAPQRPSMWLRVGVTTAITVVLWVIAYFIIAADIISFRDMAN